MATPPNRLLLDSAWHHFCNLAFNFGCVIETANWITILATTCLPRDPEELYAEVGDGMKG
jgi:hypothetical protein